jgi:hypothetical protein
MFLPIFSTDALLALPAYGGDTAQTLGMRRQRTNHSASYRKKGENEIKKLYAGQ